MTRRITVFAFCLLSVTTGAQNKIESERPSESIDPATLNKQEFQIETGFRRAVQGRHDYIWRTPNVILRYGIIDQLELRLETNVEQEHLPAKQIDRNGLTSIEIGAKARLLQTKNKKFTSAIATNFGIGKLASENYQLNKVYYRIRLLFENELTDKFKLNYNFGTEWDTEDQEQNWVYTFTPELKLGEKAEVFIELYGFLKRGDFPEHIFDGGFAYYLTKNIKLDISAGKGLNKYAAKYFIDAGFSLRINGKK